MMILISWLHNTLTDLDLICFQKCVYNFGKRLNGILNVLDLAILDAYIALLHVCSYYLKPCLRGLQTDKVQTSLLRYRD